MVWRNVWRTLVQSLTRLDRARFTLPKPGGNYPITKQFGFCLYQNIPLKLRLRTLLCKESDRVGRTRLHGHSRSFPCLYLGVMVMINTWHFNCNEGHLLRDVPVTPCGLCNYKFSLIHPLAWIYEANVVVQVTQSPVSLLVYMLCAFYQAGRKLYLTVL